MPQPPPPTWAPRMEFPLLTQACPDLDWATERQRLACSCLPNKFKTNSEVFCLLVCFYFLTGVGIVTQHINLSLGAPAAPECWFESWLLSFWPSFLITHFGRQQRTAQVCGSLTCTWETQMRLDSWSSLVQPRLWRACGCPHWHCVSHSNCCKLVHFQVVQILNLPPHIHPLLLPSPFPGTHQPDT